MKTFFLTMGVCALMTACAVGDVASWSGEALGAWARSASQCENVRLENGVVTGVVTGRDSQLYTPVEPAIAPQGNHVAYVRLKTAVGGRGQLFWIREGDRQASEARQKAFTLIGDNAWHDYRIKLGWGGTTPITRLRLDLPAEMQGGHAFELGSVRIVEEGALIDIDTAKTRGVSFSLQMPPGMHYCTLTWSGSEAGQGMFGFTPATDGLRHDYWFDLRSARFQRWGPNRGKPCWKGRIQTFAVEQTQYDRELPAENVTFVAQTPDTPADPSITSARPGEAIPRAGRPFPVEVVVRNYGTRSAKNLTFAFDGLPAGVKVIDPAELNPKNDLPGADGSETIGADCRLPLVNERVYRMLLSDLGVGAKTFGLTLTADGVAPRRVEIEADVRPSLGLAKAAYPAEPQPVNTAPYEVGAFLFPGWTTHRWHGVWSHAPWRKPVLGWYDEESPETIDWQIKHLVENGVSFVFVDWYWNRGHQHLNHWMKAFREARFRRHLKWSLMWANHNGKGSHSVADQEKVTQFWVENYFNDPQYQTIDGMPVVSIWSASGMEEDMKEQGGCKALLEVSQRVAKAAGYKGIYFIAVRGDKEDAAYHRTFKNHGFRMTCSYKYMGSVPGAPTGPAGSRPFKWLADTSLAHWRALKRNSPIPFLPSLSTAWDDRPWRGEVGWEITDVNAKDFRRICADAKSYSDETGDRLLLMGPLDEWGEGSIGYPNAELGFGMLEAVRDVFGKKPATGWPVNHAPEDVGLVCPQRLTEETAPVSDGRVTKTVEGLGVGPVTLSAASAGSWTFVTGVRRIADGLEELSVKIVSPTAAVPPRFDLAFSVPQLDAHHRWSTATERVTVPPNWGCGTSSRLCSGLPLLSFVNDTDENRILVAASEAKRTVAMEAGLREEDCRLVWKFAFFGEAEAPVTEYEVRLRLDRRPVFFGDAIREGMSWMERTAGLKPAVPPADAFSPLYSAWYSFHQNVFDREVEAECAEAAKLGMKVLIVDDGWQTDDNNRGYAFTGDWDISKRRFPDMAAHVKNVHALGMKYMIWYGVPMMGLKAKNYERFKGKYLWTQNDRWSGYSCMDPRFPEVRAYICGLYEKAMREWNLDGLKLDFIDAIGFRGPDPALKDNYAGRDIKALPEAVDRLLADIRARLVAVKPDALIEFRQGYIGPAIRQYGNMMRAADCPGDLLANRARTANLRLTSGASAVHADMLEWNAADTPENAARFVLSTMFSTIQYSMMLRTLPADHKKMIAHWIAFSQEHRDALLKGGFRPHHFEAFYPWIESWNEKERIAGVYTEGTVVPVDVGMKTNYVLNGTGKGRVVLDCAQGCIAEVFDAFGARCGERKLAAGLNAVDMPVSGYLRVGR